MSSIKQVRLAEKSILHQQEVVLELEALVKDVERCEKTIIDLKGELEGVNARHQDRKTTRDDIAYLTDLLKCANKKLAWEKHLASLQKRTPATLEKLTTLVNDPTNPPAAEMGASMLKAVQGVQAAMQRLDAVKVQ